MRNPGRVASTIVPTPHHQVRRGRQRLIAATLSAGVVLAGAACATEVPSQRDLADALFDSGLNRELADCAAEAVVGTLSEDELRLLVERGSGAPPEGESATQVREALEACRTAADQADAEATEAAPG